MPVLTCSPVAEEPQAVQEEDHSIVQFAFETSDNARFDAWRDDFAQRALEAGLGVDSIRTILSGLALHPKALAADSKQPEFVRPIQDYVRIATQPTRIKAGRARLRQYKPFMTGIYETYKIPPEILAAIWGMETNYGSYLGNFDGPQVLASMASHGRRKRLGEQQLLALVRLLEDGAIDRDQLRQTSWAGAMGQTQFMPTTFLDHAIDWDRDGKRDLWASKPDALASAANYLVQSGWQYDVPWVVEVRVPDAFDYTLGDGRALSLEEWQALGIETVSPEIAANPEHQAELFIPAGWTGPAFLLFHNFKVIKAYNHSDSYALSVGLLAHALAGRDGVQRDWPEQEPVSTEQIRQIQTFLTQFGYNPGQIDGLAGRRTRKAVAQFQKAQNMPADGFPTQNLLARLTQVAQPEAAPDMLGTVSVSVVKPPMDSEPVEASAPESQ